VPKKETLSEHQRKILQGWISDFIANHNARHQLGYEERKINIESLSGSAVNISTLKKIMGKNPFNVSYDIAKTLCIIIGRESYDLMPTSLFEKDTNSNYGLYGLILNLLELNHQSHLEKYFGIYTCYRNSNVRGNLIEGKIKIFRKIDRGEFYFEHKSFQKIGTNNLEVPFDHEGPIFILSDRMYLLGVGFNNNSAYVRPIILSVADDPRKKELVGMLLTETDHAVPFACKTVLIHEEFEEILRARHHGNEEKIKSFIRGKLRNEAKAPDIIYGWSKDR
jgi:hypothetical protein